MQRANSPPNTVAWLDPHREHIDTMTAASPSQILIMPIGWPTVVLDEVFHIGTLDPASKGQTHNTTSLEGSGLSVSVEPDAWREIARLGGNPTWELRSPEPRSFVDFHELKDEHWSAVMLWAESRGFVLSTEVIEVSWYDDECEERRAFVFDASQPKEVVSAQDEFDALIEGNYDDAEEAAADVDGPRMERHAAWRATPALNDRIGFDVSIGLVKDLALTVFVEDELYANEGFHGVWWMDNLDVGNLSAPRGVIHAAALPAWEREMLDDGLGSDRRAARKDGPR